jgi:hypothetical protein
MDFPDSLGKLPRKSAQFPPFLRSEWRIIKKNICSIGEEKSSRRRGTLVGRRGATQLIAGPQIAGCRVSYNEPHHTLVIDGHIAPLTPTEYLLALTLLRQRAQWEAASGHAPFAVSYALLRQVTGIQQRKLLARHMSNAGLKLVPFGIRIVCVGEGYVALFERDLAEGNHASL